MRKSKIYYLKKVNIVLLILWLGIINEALTLNLELIKYSKCKSNDEGENIEGSSDCTEIEAKTTETVIQSEVLNKEVKKIRVLLMDSDYSTYYHPSVTVSYEGKEETYTLESEALKDGELLIECDGEGIAISSIQRQQGTPVYQGTLEIKKTEEGLLLINELPVESYLEAVVPSEMPASYKEEALKAQAVCARTYAYKQIEKKSLEEFGADVDDSVSYQVYGNIAAQESTSEAVQETAGKVLVQDDELIEAYYFSTSSGMTSTDEVWGAEEASSYLQSVECNFDANEVWSSWNLNISWTNLQNRLQTLYSTDAELLNLQLDRKSESGAIIEMTAVTSQENVKITGEYDVRAFLSPKNCEVTGSDGTKLTGGNLLPSAYFDMEMNVGESVSISGRGYGHGVGMSQNAADEMAKEGYSWEEILTYFYKDVEIRDYA